MKVIDIHAHIYEKVAGITQGQPMSSTSQGKVTIGNREIQFLPPSFERSCSTAEALIAYMDWCGIEKALLMPNPFYGYHNYYFKESVKKYPDRLRGVALVDIMKGKAAAEELAQIYDEGILFGMKIEVDSTFQCAPGTRLADPKLAPVWDCCEQYHNLFQTLMLNLTLLKDGRSLWEGEDKPIWEREPSKKERQEIAVPDNLAELLTLQSRRLLLKRDHNKVVGYYLLGGDFFDKNLAYAEQMTVWREVKEKDRKFFTPRRHDPSRQMWRDFGSIFVESGSNVRKPGVVSWYDTIATEMQWKIRPIRFRIASVQYGDKDFFVNDTFSDSLAFQGELLLQMSRPWQSRILDEINKCEEVAGAIGMLEGNLAKAEGRDADIVYAKELFYDRIDQPFRRWLMEILPETDDISKTCKKLDEIIQMVGKELGEEMVSNAGEAAFAGRMKDDVYYASPEAYNWFLGKLHKIYH